MSGTRPLEPRISRKNVRGKKTRSPGYEVNNHWNICDLCGCAIRNHDTRLTWDGKAVCPDDWDYRHPQDFVRGRADDPSPTGITRPDSSGAPASRDPVSAYVAERPIILNISPTTGVSGTAFTLTGTNFVEGATLFFGGTECTDLTFVSATQFTGTVPDAGVSLQSVSVVLTNPSGETGQTSFYYADQYPSWNITNMSGKGTYNMSTLGQGASGIEFSSDGLNVYVADAQSPYGIRQWGLTNPWDITTITGSVFYLPLLGGLDGQTTDLKFNPTGTILLWSDNSNNRIHRLDLSTPWDLSTATSSGSVSMSGKMSGTLHGFEVSPDGTMALLHESGSGVISSATMSTPWDITTITGYGAAFNPSLGGLYGSLGFTAHPEGLQMYITASSTGSVYEYDLSTPWDASTATHNGITSSVVGIGPGLYINQEGSCAYDNNVFTDLLYSYDMAP